MEDPPEDNRRVVADDDKAADIVDLLESSDDEDKTINSNNNAASDASNIGVTNKRTCTTTTAEPKHERKKKRKTEFLSSSSLQLPRSENSLNGSRNVKPTHSFTLKKAPPPPPRSKRIQKEKLQAGLVLEEDIFDSFGSNVYSKDETNVDDVTVFIQEQQERIHEGLRPLLWEDPDFPPISSSIQGVHQDSMINVLLENDSSNTGRTVGNGPGSIMTASASAAAVTVAPSTSSVLSSNGTKSNKNPVTDKRKITKGRDISSYFPKCRCGRICQLSFKRGQQKTSRGRGGSIVQNSSDSSNNRNGKKRSNRKIAPANRPYFHCAGGTGKKCQWFSWAFTAELMPWYRFGLYNNHRLLAAATSSGTTPSLSQHKLRSSLSTSSSSTSSASVEAPVSLFSAQDLVQGKVGDCWFLSALAVVAERPDLIQRLFQRPDRVGPNGGSTHNVNSNRSLEVLHDWKNEDDQFGIVHVNLFVDGRWTRITMDNYLPCLIGNINQQEDDDIKQAIKVSLEESTRTFSEGNIKDGHSLKQTSKDATSTHIVNPYTKDATLQKKPSSQDLLGIASQDEGRSYSDGATSRKSVPRYSYDPHTMSTKNVQNMKTVCEYLDRERRERFGISNTSRYVTSTDVHSSSNGNDSPYDGYVLNRTAESGDLAYSKGRRNQLWVPFIEKAYCKVYGSYKAISGGHIAEAFLDLTGAPTLQIQWHQGRSATQLNSCIMEPRHLWSKLLHWRAQRLPMGCGTDNSAGGIIGMHAYSILDVQEITNVDVDFFHDQLASGTLGNVSGFTEYDGKVRLLRIRNPHGRGEWKGDFSDKSDSWKRLLTSTGVTLPRTDEDDGTFWMAYDDFLCGFANIDVVLAFAGNHAKSFSSNFPEKKSNHRCSRAFEVSLLDPQPGIEIKDKVEVYVMGIQKSGRGARRGRSDRKKSYKVSDLGLIVKEFSCNQHGDDDDKDNDEASGCVHGQMFGYRRNGHYRLLLDRKRCRRMVVVPISFGHPAATDKELSYVVRFNADAPLMIRELPSTPRMDILLRDFIFGPKPTSHFMDTRQGQQKVLFETKSSRVIQVNYLGNHGGTVFVYFCGDDSCRYGNDDQAISLVVTGTCRGMTARVDGKLLEHETVSKGKKFEAAWRRYTSEFVDLTKSRLLMVLYQSGQDTEMGTMTCQMANRLGSGPSSPTVLSPQSKLKASTLDKYWQKDSSKNQSLIDSDPTYAAKGIFNSVSMDTTMFRASGRLDQIESTADAQGFGITDGGTHFQDVEYQRALDLSRQEDDLQRAINASLTDQNNGAAVDTTSLDKSSIATTASSDGTADDADLTEALKRSLADLRRPDDARKEIVLLDDSDDSDDDENENEGKPSACDSRTNPTGNTSQATEKRSNGTKMELVDLTSDADADDESQTSVKNDEQTETTDCTKPINREELRKKMADAAMKRFANQESANPTDHS